MKKLALIFTLVLATLILAANVGTFQPLAGEVTRIFPLADKVVHFLFMGIWSLLANLALSTSTVPVAAPLRLTKVSALLVCLSVVEETSHLFLTYRVFALGDIVANVGGIIAFGWLASLIADRFVELPDVAAKEPT